MSEYTRVDNISGRDYALFDFSYANYTIDLKYSGLGASPYTQVS